MKVRLVAPNNEGAVVCMEGFLKLGFLAESTLVTLKNMFSLLNLQLKTGGH